MEGSDATGHDQKFVMLSCDNFWQDKSLVDSVSGMSSILELNSCFERIKISVECHENALMLAFGIL